MALNQTNKIVWLVDTIKRAGKISFHDLNELWKENECLGAGTDLSKRTLHKWIDVVFDTFGIIVANEGRGEYRYYLENPDELKNGSMERWLYSVNSVSNALMEHKSLHGRIILENIPSAENHLDTIMTAMKNNGNYVGFDTAKIQTSIKKRVNAVIYWRLRWRGPAFLSNFT